MARFDVYRFPSEAAPFVVDVQADFLSDMSSRVVIPLMPVLKAEKEAVPRLKPRLSLQGEDYILMTTDISAIPVGRLGDCVMNIEREYRDVITTALDFLLSGF